MTPTTLLAALALVVNASQATAAQVADPPTGHISAETIQVVLHDEDIQLRAARIGAVWLPAEHPALRYRVLVPSEAMRMEAVLHVVRDRPLEHFFDPRTDCTAHAVTNLLLWLHKWPHAAAIGECVRTLEAQLRRLTRDPPIQVPGWDYFWYNAVTNLPSERRVYAAAYRWAASSNPSLRRAGESYRRKFHACWLRMRRPNNPIQGDVLIWPLPSVLHPKLRCVFNPSPRPTTLTTAPYRPRVAQLVPGDSASAELVLSLAEEQMPRRLVRSKPRGGEAPIRVALRTIVSNDTYPVHLRLRALDLLVRRVGDYDTGFLRRLALASKEDFATEVLALAAVCALSRCPSKGALRVLAELVHVGPEWVAFQAASHLRYVAGLELPALVAMSDEGKPGVIDYDRGDWIDVARWLVIDAERLRVSKELQAQIARLPEDWPWHAIERLRPYLLHEHLNPRETARKDIPAVVMERSAGEDFFWRPFEGQGAGAR